MNRVAVVVMRVASLDRLLVATFGSVRVSVTSIVVEIVIARLAQVPVIEVQPARFLVVIRRSVHVCEAGQEAEHQIEGATPQCNSPPHPRDCIRRLAPASAIR